MMSHGRIPWILRLLNCWIMIQHQHEIAKQMTISWNLPTFQWSYNGRFEAILLQRPVLLCAQGTLGPPFGLLKMEFHDGQNFRSPSGIAFFVWNGFWSQPSTTNSFRIFCVDCVFFWSQLSTICWLYRMLLTYSIYHCDSGTGASWRSPLWHPTANLSPL